MYAARILVVTAVFFYHLVTTSGRFPDLHKFNEGFRENMHQCSLEQKVTQLQVLALLESSADNPGYNRPAKCFLCCMMQRYDLIAPDGKYQVENIRKLSDDLPENSTFTATVHNNLDTCLKEDNEDVCEKCYQFTRCFYKHMSAPKVQIRIERAPGIESGYNVYSCGC